jgi:ABC-type Zn2+ transport system substrate-binding protein/surface adhesin
MTKDEIIDMARKAGGIDLTNTRANVTIWIGTGTSDFIDAFAKLIAEAEREACAKLCDLAMLQNQETINELEEDEHVAQCFIQGAMNQLVKTSKAIRARGKNE